MLRFIDRFADWLRPRVRGLGVCGHSGAIAGMVVGGVIVLLDTIEEQFDPQGLELIQLWLGLTAFAWLVVLFAFIVLVRWTFGSVAVPTLVNTLLVAGLVVLVCWLTGAYGLGFLFGLLIGMLVGWLLCFLFRLVTRGGVGDGLH